MYIGDCAKQRAWWTGMRNDQKLQFKKKEVDVRRSDCRD